MQIFMSFFLKSPFPLLRSFPRFIGGHHGCKGTAFFACMQVFEQLFLSERYLIPQGLWGYRIIES